MVDTDKETPAIPTGGSTVDIEDVSLLVTRAQSGDVSAFEQLLRRMHGPLRQYLNNLAGAPAADDILQEVAFKVPPDQASARAQSIHGMDVSDRHARCICCQPWRIALARAGTRP